VDLANADKTMKEEQLEFDFIKDLFKKKNYSEAEVYGVVWKLFWKDQEAKKHLTNTQSCVK
jgi:hypothetical protein